MNKAFRIANLFLAVGVATALTLEISLFATNRIDALFNAPTEFVPFGTRLVEMFSFLTTLSNLLAGIVAILLAVRPGRTGRVWRVIRLDALVSMVAIGLAFQILFAPHLTLTSAPLVMTLIYHVVNPLLAVLAWLLLDRRRQWSFRDVALSLIWPTLYLAAIFTRGAFAHWYPYALADVDTLGGRAYLNGLGVIVLFFAIGCLAFLIDSRVPSMWSRARELQR